MFIDDCISGSSIDCSLGICIRSFSGMSDNGKMGIFVGGCISGSFTCGMLMNGRGPFSNRPLKPMMIENMANMMSARLMKEVKICLNFVFMLNSLHLKYCFNGGFSVRRVL